MINFCVKFLICFLKPEPPPKKEPKTKQAGKLVGKKGKQTEPPEVEEPINAPEEKDQNIVYCVENAREWCHIEYSLLKNVLPTVDINVVTWGEAAKVYMQGDCQSLKTVVIGNLVWVYFEIHHKSNVFNAADVVKFKDSRITFTFSQDPKKMMSAAANDWPKKFVVCHEPNEEMEGPRWFAELIQVDPPDGRYDRTSTRIDNYKISRPHINSIVTIVTANLCEKGLVSKIVNVSETLPVVEQPVDLPKKGKTILDTKGKKQDKKGKEVVPDDSNQLSLEAGLLIAGRYDACAERTEITKTLRYAGVFANSSKVLTDEQDVTYAPLIVSLHNIEALPVDQLQQLNVNKVFARYELEDMIGEIESQKYPLQENIAIDETRVFFLSGPEEENITASFMERPSMLRLAEVLLTRTFVVKIYGETDPVVNEVEPCIFGDRPTDPFISTPDHEMFLNYKPPETESTEIFIGSAYFNLIQLIKGYSVVDGCSVLTSSSLPFWDPVNVRISDSTAEEIRTSLLSRFKTSGIISEAIFLDKNTRVKLRVSTTLQLTSPEDSFLIKLPQVSHRAIVIFKDKRYNNKIIDLIEKTNEMLDDNIKDSIISNTQSVRFVGSSSKCSKASLLSTRLSDFRKLNLMLQEMLRKKDLPKKVITGFFVEHESQSILVCEAMTYVIPPLIAQIQAMFKSEDCARIICDSSIFFTERMYMEFSPIFKIKLRKPLDELLKTPNFYTKKNLHDEALQALLLLDLLRRCRTLNCACINQLFPSRDQLVSFSKVFGKRGSTIVLNPSEASLKSRKNGGTLTR